MPAARRARMRIAVTRTAFCRAASAAAERGSAAEGRAARIAHLATVAEGAKACVPSTGRLADSNCCVLTRTRFSPWVLREKP